MDFINQQVQPVFEQYPEQTKQVLLKVRQWIYEIAQNSEQIGQIQECLKWGEPSYLTSNPKSGTTLRLSQPKPDEFGLFVHCQTSLIEEFKLVYPDCHFDKNRGIIFAVNQPLQAALIKQFIFLALTYHSRKVS